MSIPTIDEVRGHVHGMWAGVAHHWADYADEVDQRGLAVTEVMLSSVDLRSGDRVLELACGPGGAGLAAAERVGPDGAVLLSDVVPEMAAIAAERAARRGLVNVHTATRDLEAIDEADCSFDVVICRDGLMFAVEPERAVAEIHRVLRPSGRATLAVWGPQAENPWLGVIFDAVTAVTGFRVPPPGMPGPFALDDEVRLRELFEAAGFDDVQIDRLPAPLHSPSFEAWWVRTKAIAGPVSALLARLDDTSALDLETRLRAAVAPYTTSSGLDLPGLALLISARRP